MKQRQELIDSAEQFLISQSQWNSNRLKKAIDDISLPKINVRYMTEFGSKTTILELNELLSFTKRFNVLSIDWE